MAKRLYVVTISLEYAVLADDEDEACSYVREAVRDASLSDEDGEASEAKRSGYCLPSGWGSDTLVYGGDGDVMWKEAVTEEKEADAEAKRIADFTARQTALPIE
jgi:hypothetical protein